MSVNGIGRRIAGARGSPPRDARVSGGAEAGLRLVPDDGPAWRRRPMPRRLGRGLLGGDRERGLSRRLPRGRLGAGRALRQADLLGRDPEWRGLGGDGRGALAPVGRRDVDARDASVFRRLPDDGRRRRVGRPLGGRPRRLAEDGRRRGPRLPRPGAGIVTSMLAGPAGARRRAVDRERGALDGRGLDRATRAASGRPRASAPSRPSAARSGPGRTSRFTPGTEAPGSWTPRSARHDVRALTSWGGALRAATVDAGVLVRARVGLGGRPDRSSFRVAGRPSSISGPTSSSGRSEEASTGGRESGWTPLVGPSPAAVVTDVVAARPGRRNGLVGRDLARRRRGALVTLPNGGPFRADRPTLGRLPDGCGEATAVARTSGAWPRGARRDELRSVRRLGVGRDRGLGGPVRRELPDDARVALGSDLRRDGHDGPLALLGRVVVRRAGRAATRARGTVNAVRSFGGSLWVAMAEGLFSRGSGPWAEVSAGLPSGGLVVSLGGDAGAAFAGLATGGVYRRPTGELLPQGLGRPELGAGLLHRPLRRAALGGRGARGLALKRDGAWSPETAGLPPGASVTVVRNLGSDGDGREGRPSSSARPDTGRTSRPRDPACGRCRSSSTSSARAARGSSRSSSSARARRPTPRSPSRTRLLRASPGRAERSRRRP